ncbi:MAG: methyltransferase domain-containing protein [bacterium]
MPINIILPLKPEGSKDDQSTTGKLINNITFFGDSAIVSDNPIYQSVWNAAKLLAENGFTIVDGGGPGIMKAATDGAESVGGHTVAIYWQPKLASIFEGKNLANVTDESETCSNYMMRTLGLIEKGDAYVVCKGGTGTISEFGMVWALAKLYYGCHKPVILFGEFWDDIITAFQKDMLIDEMELGVLYQANAPEDILRIIEEHEQKIQHCKDKQVEGDEAAFLISGNHRGAVIKAYNSIAQSYHDEHAGKLIAQDQLDEFMKLVNPPAHVLDIGCGAGFDTRYLAQKYTVKGVEISKKFYEIAKYENPDLDIVLADIVTHELETNTYKGIWARNSLHHLNDEALKIVFPKIAAALVEGGIFYIIVREGEGEIYEEDSHYYKTVRNFFHLFTKEELIERTAQVGLEMIRVDNITRSHNWLNGVFRKK